MAKRSVLGFVALSFFTMEHSRTIVHTGLGEAQRNIYEESFDGTRRAECWNSRAFDLRYNSRKRRGSKGEEDELQGG
jgi:hypothetical protein